MTPEEAIEMLTAKAECIRREASGTDIDCNLRNCDECDLCYKQGTMGDQMEALGVAISALQAQEETVSRKVYEQISWERDIAVMQLKDLGYSLGEKIRTDGDLISRADAIDAAMEYGKKIPTYAILVKNAIEQLPSAQPEQKWIPCSERLPEQYGNYLISIHGEDEPDIGTINPNDKRGWSLCDANGFHWASDKKLIVTAWMPLPEPYKERWEE